MATGGSTYGEITCGNMENIVYKTSTLNWIKAEGDCTTPPDLGAGYMVMLAHLTQGFSLATIVEVENCALQAYGDATATMTFCCLMLS
jgi:hypothetical protein